MMDILDILSSYDLVYVRLKFNRKALSSQKYSILLLLNSAGFIRTPRSEVFLLVSGFTKHLSWQMIGSTQSHEARLAFRTETMRLVCSPYN